MKNCTIRQKKYQKIYGFEIGIGKHDTHNNQADAFKHTFGAAEISLKSLSCISKAITDKHERDGNTKMGQKKDDKL